MAQTDPFGSRRRALSVPDDSAISARARRIRSTVRAMSSPLDLARAWVDAGTVPAVAAASSIARACSTRRTPACASVAGDPVGAGTRFALASLTKPLTAAACLCAVEEGLLDLDEEVRDGFTLRHLLSHCSGLPADADDLDARPLEPAGSYRRYSNAGYALAARLVEDRGGDALSRVPGFGRARATPAGRLARPRAGRTPGARRSCASRASGRTASSSSTARPSALRRSPRAAASRRRWDTPASSAACSTAGVPAGSAARPGDRRRDARDPVRRAAGRRRGRRDVGRLPLGPRPRRARDPRAALDGRRR